MEHAKSQLFAWEAGAKGLDVHALAEPTKLEALKREYVTKKSELKDEAKSKIFDKYGGESHLQAPPRELIFAQTEEYVEYSRSGKLLKGQENTGIKSRYEEDVFPGNHTSVWGSYWSAGRWGYKCCHSFIKNSYCTGEAGKNAFSNSCSMISEKASEVKSDEKEVKEDTKEDTLEQKSDENDDSESSSDSEAERKRKKKKKKKDKKKKRKKSSKQKDFEDEVKEAMRKQEREEKEIEMAKDDRKRGYNSMYENKTLTEAEMEAYYRKRQRDEDPMKNF